MAKTTLSASALFAAAVKNTDNLFPTHLNDIMRRRHNYIGSQWSEPTTIKQLLKEDWFFPERRPAFPFDATILQCNRPGFMGVDRLYELGENLELELRDFYKCNILTLCLNGKHAYNPVTLTTVFITELPTPVIDNIIIGDPIMAYEISKSALIGRYSDGERITVREAKKDGFRYAYLIGAQKPQPIIVGNQTDPNLKRYNVHMTVPASIRTAITVIAPDEKEARQIATDVIRRRGGTLPWCFSRVDRQCPILPTDLKRELQFSVHEILTPKEPEGAEWNQKSGNLGVVAAYKDDASKAVSIIQ